MQTDAIHFDRLNVPFSAACGLLVHQSCFREGCRIRIHGSCHDFPLAVNYTEVEYITRLDQMGWPSNSAVNQDSAALDVLSGELSGLVEASSPQPLINTH